MKRQFFTFENALTVARELVKKNHDPDNDNWLQIVHSPNPKNQAGDFWLEDSEDSFLIRTWESQIWTYDSNDGEHFTDDKVTRLK